MVCCQLSLIATVSKVRYFTFLGSSSPLRKHLSRKNKKQARLELLDSQQIISQRYHYMHIKNGWFDISSLYHPLNFPKPVKLSPKAAFKNHSKSQKNQKIENPIVLDS